MNEAARFPRRARLLKPAEFKAVFERGARLHERGLTAVCATNTLAHPRLGLAIAKKSLPLAVDRNRLKRRLRDTFRLNQRNLPAVGLVILAKPGSRTDRKSTRLNSSHSCAARMPSSS